MASLRYRADVDGLRAVAIISVVAFHAWPNYIKFGFIGVDIFFVISGFLISNIIFRRAQDGGFSYRDFYVSRVKRIFPSLVIVLMATMAIGWFVLFAVEYRQLAIQLIAAATFTSNIALWLDTGYFDSAAVLKPLLHLWSLGIEEQFYIVWPAIALVAFRYRRFLGVTGVLAALSLIAGIRLSYSDQLSTAFYMPFTRFWELASGGLLAFLTLQGQQLKPKVAHCVSVAGFSLYVLGLATIRSTTVFPGILAVIPVLGAALIILAGPQAILNRRFLSNPLMVYVGLISYPLYLWHWPLLVFCRTLQGAVPSPLQATAAVAVALILAVLCYELVEKRIRTVKSGTLAVLSLLGGMVCVGLLGAAVYAEKGVSARAINQLNPSDRNLGVIGGDLTGCNSKAPVVASIAYCVIQNHGEPFYAMVGDSKASALFAGVLETAGADGRWMLVGGHAPKGSPLPVISSAPQYAGVQPMARGAIDLIARTRSIKVVVLVMATRDLFLSQDRFLENLGAVGNYRIAYDGLDRTIAELAAAGKKIVIVMDNPGLEESSICLPRNTEFALVNRLFKRSPNEHCQITIADFSADTRPYGRLLEELRGKWGDRLAIFNPLDALCDKGSATCYAAKDGHALYSYSDHLSAYGAFLEAEQLIPFVDRLGAR